MFLIPALITLILLTSFSIALRVGKFMGDCESQHPSPIKKETLK